MESNKNEFISLLYNVHHPPMKEITTKNTKVEVNLLLQPKTWMFNPKPWSLFFLAILIVAIIFSCVSIVVNHHHHLFLVFL
jgi:hypothetical protein